MKRFSTNNRQTQFNMTQEEKAKAYDKALRQAKAAIDIAADKDLVRGVVKTIFPELKESRDEQIRKAIIKSLDMPFPEDNLPGTDVTSKEAVDWLEKQNHDGKKWITPAELNRLLTLRYEAGFDDGVRSEMKKQKEQKEQKPAEWSEDYREEDIQTRFAFYTYKDDPSVLYLSNVFVEETSRNHGFGTRILKAAEKAAEAIGAITICLKVKQDSPANAWYRKRGYGYVAFEDGYDWLEKNLEYLKPKRNEQPGEGLDVTDFCKPIDPGIAQCVADHWWEMVDEESTNKKPPESLEVDLEKEIDECAKSDLCPDDCAFYDFTRIARHFAEWGAEYARKEDK